MLSVRSVNSYLYVIIRLILKGNGFFDYISSKTWPHRTQPEDVP